MSQLPTTRLACGDTMHTECWLGWERRCRAHDRVGTCPMCRRQVGAPPAPMTHQQARAASALRYRESTEAYEVENADWALMRLTRRVGESPESTPAMVALLRSLPRSLVADVATNRAPEDLEGAIRDALLRLTQNQAADPRVVAALSAPPQMLATLARLARTPHRAQTEEDELAAAAAAVAAAPDFEADRAELERRVSQHRRRLAQPYPLIVEGMDSIMDALEHEPETVSELLHFQDGPEEAALHVWYTLAPEEVARVIEGLSETAHADIGSSLMRGHDMRPKIVELAAGTSATPEELEEFARRADAMSEFIACVV